MSMKKEYFQLSKPIYALWRYNFKNKGPNLSMDIP